MNKEQNEEYQYVQSVLCDTTAALTCDMAEIWKRVQDLECRMNDHEVQQEHCARLDEIYQLRYEFNLLRTEMNEVLLQLQVCARNLDIVDEEGGSLDAFINTFVR